MKKLSLLCLSLLLTTPVWSIGQKNNDSCYDCTACKKRICPNTQLDAPRRSKNFEASGLKKSSRGGKKGQRT